MDITVWTQKHFSKPFCRCGVSFEIMDTWSFESEITIADGMASIYVHGKPLHLWGHYWRYCYIFKGRPCSFLQEWPHFCTIVDAIKETQYHLNFNNYLELSISICVKTTTSIVCLTNVYSWSQNSTEGAEIVITDHCGGV